MEELNCDSIMKSIPYFKKRTMCLRLLTALSLSVCFCGCAKKTIVSSSPSLHAAGEQTVSSRTNTLDRQIIVGFSQIGAESAWRTRNTESVQSAARLAGIQLVYDNAEQKQENQLKAIRSFIVYQVDVIVFVPIVETGWDSVLREAQDAHIPVLVIDRKIKTKDESLYAGYIGTDSYEEGRNAARFLQKKYNTTGPHAQIPQKPYTIFEIRGTEGSSPAVGRAAGFREILSDDKSFKIVSSVSGDFLRSLGREVMAHQLDTGSRPDIIFSHNDGMTLGVLDELDSRGIKPGKDVVIVTIDAEQKAIDSLREGRVNCVIECNPNIGPDVMQMAETLASHHSIPHLVHVHEAVFDENSDLSAITPRGY